MSASNLCGKMVAVHDDLKLEVAEYGHGEPLVIVNGTTQHFKMWDPVIPALSSHYRVICFNQRGIGESPRGKQEMTMASLAKDMNDLLTVLSIDRAHIMGWSLGGAVTQEFAMAYPDRTASAILYGTWARTNGLLRSMIIAMRHPWATGDRDIALAALGLGFSSEALESEGFAQLIGQMEPYMPRTKSQMDACADQWDADEKHDTLDRLHTLRAPTLVLAPEQDLLCSVEMHELLAKNIPNSELKVMTGKGSSHAAYMERPGDFVEIVLEFLKRQKI